MAASLSFAAQKFPKRHAHVVEECRALDVRDVLPELDAAGRAGHTSWHPPTYPGLTLVARQAGRVRRWWFVCPACGRRCETLFVPPDVVVDDWRCRMCWGLVYASQRYGRRHPLRKQLTARKRISQTKAAARERTAARRRRHEPIIQIEVPRFGEAAPPLEQRTRVVTGAQLEAEERARRAQEEELRDLLAADAEKNARFLGAHRGSRSVQARAGRLLARMARTAGPEPTRASPTRVGRRTDAPSSITPAGEDRARLGLVSAEDETAPEHQSRLRAPSFAKDACAMRETLARTRARLADLKRRLDAAGAD